MAGGYEFIAPYVSTSPSSVPERVVESPKEETPTASQLEKEVQHLKDLLKAQASNADRKINEQTTSIQALKKTLEDTLVQLKTTKKAESKSTPSWNDMFNPTPTSQVVKEEDMTEDQINALVQKKVEELARSSYEYQQNAKSKEEELVTRFNSTDFKDLHKHKDKVAALWSQFASANPNEDPDVRFQRTVVAARQILSTQSNPVPESGDGYHPTSDPESFTSKKGPRTFGEAVSNEVQKEKERHGNLQKYVADRVRSQHTKLGFDYSKLQ